MTKFDSLSASQSELNTRFDRWMGWLENALLTIILFIMIGVALAQIILREGFGSGFVWADEFLRLMVLWLALIGGLSAARTQEHLLIDIAQRVLGVRGRAALNVLVSIVVAIVLAVFAYYSWRFMLSAKTYQDVVLGDVPAWWFISIMPVSLGLMALYYVRHAVFSVITLMRWRQQRPMSS